MGEVANFIRSHFLTETRKSLLQSSEVMQTTNKSEICNIEVAYRLWVEFIQLKMVRKTADDCTWTSCAVVLRHFLYFSWNSEHICSVNLIVNHTSFNRASPSSDAQFSRLFLSNSFCRWLYCHQSMKLTAHHHPKSHDLALVKIFTIQRNTGICQSKLIILLLWLCLSTVQIFEPD